jgi:signal transduction histidine kinase
MVFATLADVTEDSGFARLVSLACHDLRTPLATVNGFARTLTRFDQLEEPMPRYLQMMATAADQMGALLDDLGLVARIESGRWEGAWRETDTLQVARDAAALVHEAPVHVSGVGEAARLETDATQRALASFARCAARHGAQEAIQIDVSGHEWRLTTVTADAAPIVLGEDLRDFGAAVAARVVSALGGSVAVDGETLVVRLPVARES